MPLVPGLPETVDEEHERAGSAFEEVHLDAFDFVVARREAGRHRELFSSQNRGGQRAVLSGKLPGVTDLSGVAAMIDAAMKGLFLSARNGVQRNALEQAVSAVLAAWDAYKSSPA